jgi:hypothetical protein
MRKEKTYINKLNLALVQVSNAPYMSVNDLMDLNLPDSETGVATQLADFHY